MTMENREQQTIEEVAGKHLYASYEVSDFFNDCYAAMQEWAKVCPETEHLRQQLRESIKTSLHYRKLLQICKNHNSVSGNEHLRQENAELKGVRNTLNNARNELVSKVTDLELANEGLKEHIKDQKQLVDVLMSAAEIHLRVQQKLEHENKTLIHRIKELEKIINQKP